MKQITCLFLLISTGICCPVLAQTQPTNEPAFNLEAVTGLSFFNNALVLVNQEDLLPQEVQPEDYYRLQLITKFNYLPLDEKFVVGAHLGAGFESFKIENNDTERVSARLFKFGLHTQYEFLNIRGIRPYVELGTNYNIYRRPQLNSTADQASNYLKSYLDLGFRVKVSTALDLALVFKDLATYYNNATNFEERNNFTISPILKNFFEFPHFSIVYTLN